MLPLHKYQLPHQRVQRAVRVMGYSSLLITPLLASAAAFAEDIRQSRGCDVAALTKADAHLLAAPLRGAETSHLSSPIRLLSWNIQKVSNTGWQQSLKNYSDRSDLILLQEATVSETLSDHMPSMTHVSLAPGYHDGSVQTGVLTASKASAVDSCYQNHKEPWLQTPKAAHMSWYRIQDSQHPLLVINVHSVNFALGLGDFKRQLEAAVAIAELHEGPLILSGDFNTWSQRRMSRLMALAQKLGLETVDFDSDHRSRVFGHALDHIFVRGFTVTHSETRITDSSDHNPLFAELTLDKAFYHSSDIVMVDDLDDLGKPDERLQ